MDRQETQLVALGMQVNKQEIQLVTLGTQVNGLVTRQEAQNAKLDSLSVEVGKQITGRGSECTDPFYLNLSKANFEDDWYTFSHSIPETKETTKLFVRECYKSISEAIIKDKYDKCVISGTPGIGKSLFLIYLTIKLIEQKERVLLIFHPKCILFAEDGAITEFGRMSDLPHHTCAEFWKNEMWILFDSKCKCESDLINVMGFPAHLVVSTSPRTSLLHDYVKPPVPTTFYIPIWLLDEMEKLASVGCGKKTKWEERFKYLGGIPRDVIEDVTFTPSHILKHASSKCNLQKCIDAVGTDSVISDRVDVVHALVHTNSIKPYRVCWVQFASETAMNYILATKADMDRRALRECLNTVHGNPLAGSLLGYVWESYVIDKLMMGGNLEMRKLPGKRDKNAKYKSETLVIPESAEKIFCHKVEENQAANKLHVPMHRNHAAFDAWMPGVGGFQITLNANHGIVPAALEMIKLLGTEGQKFLWCVPPNLFEGFTTKTPLEIPQYVVKFEYPLATDKKTELAVDDIISTLSGVKAARVALSTPDA